MTVSPLRPWAAGLALLAATSALAQSAGEAMPVAGSADPEADEAVLAAGREVFLETAEPQCAVCHTLAEAGAAGEIGPDLDGLAPDAARVRAAVSQGVGIMPAYGEVLTPEQIDAVSAYVSTVAGSGQSDLQPD